VRQPLGSASVDTLKDVEGLMRLREPAAWVALAVLALNIVLAVVGLATFQGSLLNAGWVLSARVANPVPFLVLVVLVSFCVLRQRTPHARQLTIISLVVGVIAVLLGLGLALLGFGASAPMLAVFAAILLQALSVIGLGMLIKLLQLQAVPRRLPAGIGLAPYPSESLPTPPVPDQRLQPTWHPDTAAGAAWRTAGDAAAGAPATGWGAETSSVGWQPIPMQPTPPEPSNQSTVPVREQQPPSRAQDPWADQGQRNSQPPVLDWWGRPQS
jgi:hypothetical protein